MCEYFFITLINQLRSSVLTCAVLTFFTMFSMRPWIFSGGSSCLCGWDYSKGSSLKLEFDNSICLSVTFNTDTTAFVIDIS